MALFKIFVYQLYLLQLENYELRRYFSVASKKTTLFPPVMRKSLVWTPKLKTVFAISIALELVAAIVLAVLLWYYAAPHLVMGVILAVLAIFVLLFGYCLFLAVAVILTMPVDYFMKQRLMRAASQKLTNLSNLKIIAVVGSYGKTTMKEVVSAILAERYQIIKTPETINTPLGLARLILDEVTEATEFLIVEIGEHYPGDVRQLCQFLKPDLGIVTGITEAHFERFGNLKSIINTIFEIARYTSPNMPLVLNADDPLIVTNYKNQAGNHLVSWYSGLNNSLCSYKVNEVQFDFNRLGVSFAVEENGFAAVYATSFLSNYIVGTIIAAIIIGRHFGVKEKDFSVAVEKLQPIPHRLQPIKSEAGVLIIDDSYNGNPVGVKEAIAVLGSFIGRRRIYITPGLVEAGTEAPAIHEQIGRSLSQAVDMVLLIRNSVTPYVYNGLIKGGFQPGRIIWYDSAVQAHAALPDIVKKDDVVLFQNDWPDNYL